MLHALRALRRLVLVCTLLLGLSACDQGKEAVESYHVRGLVQEVSGSGVDARVAIHHEAVPRFKDRDGKASSMESMTMIFGFGPGVAPKDVSAGDKIIFDFEVHWSTSPALVVTKVQNLPPDTALTLAGAR